MARRFSLSLEYNGHDGLIVGAPRLMWLYVGYDLPVGTRQERNAAVRFHKALEDLGFERFQFSLYRKFCGSQAKADSVARLAIQAIPKKGRVALFTLTDKQVARMVLYENRSKKPGAAPPEQLLLL